MSEHTAIVDTDAASKERKAQSLAEARAEIALIAAEQMRQMVKQGWVMECVGNARYLRFPSSMQK